MAVLTIETLTPGLYWSPYYKVTTEDVEDGMVLISVNGVLQQLIGTGGTVEARPGREDLRQPPTSAGRGPVWAMS